MIGSTGMTDIGHTIAPGDKITINDDNWENVGVTYKVKSVVYVPGSTAVDLILEICDSREIVHKVVANQYLTKV